MFKIETCFMSACWSNCCCIGFVGVEATADTAFSPAAGVVLLLLAFDSTVHGEVDSIVDGKVDSIVDGEVDSIVDGEVDSYVDGEVDSYVDGEIV